MKNTNMDSFYRIIKQGKLMESDVQISPTEEKEIDYYRNNIRKFCDAYECDYNDTIKGIMSYPQFRHFFEKNRKKQSREEAQQYEIIKSAIEGSLEKETGYKSIAMGRTSGRGSKKKFEFRINEHGKLLHGAIKYDSDPESKTFDTVISLEKGNELLDVYIAQKDTGSGSQNSTQGGAQSSVGSEMGDTARYCLKNNDNALFVFLLDSSYWHTVKKSRKESEFEHFKTLYGQKKILVTTSAGFKEDFINHLKKYY